MARQRESLFKEKVVRDLRDKLGVVYWIKTQERGRRGVPDIFFCLKGRFGALELKTDSGKPDDLQLQRLAKIREAGGFAIVTCPNQWHTDVQIIREVFDERIE